MHLHLHLQYISWGFGMLGAALIATKALRAMWRRRQEALIKRRLAEAEAQRIQRQQARQAAAAAAAAGGTGASGQGQGQGAGAAVSTSGQGGGAGVDLDPDRPPNTCVVCMDDDVEMVFTACGHMCCCYSCGWQMTRCPICRTNSKPIRVYRP